MAKYYVESGTLQMITDAEDARGAALWAMHSAMEQVLPVCPDDPLTPAEKNERIRQRGCVVLDGAIRISEQGFGRPDAETFDTVGIFVEWNQLVMAMTKLERRLKLVNP
ncbi:MAG: hypothetical protein GX575_20410 [Candidatus Anammoximicrobium sp.]|nr:hypothetical protein [Candidatus Anammoximicrobium sp.]